MGVVLFLISGAIGGGGCVEQLVMLRGEASSLVGVGYSGETGEPSEDIMSEAADLPDRVKRVCGRLKECIMFSSVWHWLIQRAMDELETVEGHSRPSGGRQGRSKPKLDRDQSRLHGGSPQARRKCLPMRAGIDCLKQFWPQH